MAAGRVVFELAFAATAYLHSWEEETMFVFACLHFVSDVKFPQVCVKF